MGKDRSTWKKHTELVAANDSSGIVHCTWHSKVVLPSGWRRDGHKMHIKRIGNLEADVDEVKEAFQAVPLKFGKKGTAALKRVGHLQKGSLCICS